MDCTIVLPVATADESAAGKHAEHQDHGNRHPDRGRRGPGNRASACASAEPGSRMYAAMMTGR